MEAFEKMLLELQELSEEIGMRRDAGFSYSDAMDRRRFLVNKIVLSFKKHYNK
jgi:hypothetical protein